MTRRLVPIPTIQLTMVRRLAVLLAILNINSLKYIVTSATLLNIKVCDSILD